MVRWRAVGGALALVLVLAPGAGAQRRPADVGGVRDAGATPPPPAETPEACDEVFHAVQYEDLTGAERAYAECRAHVVPADRTMNAEELRLLEDVAAALHELRRPDGSFCVQPAAPFDFARVLEGARDTRACFVALDRLLTSERGIERVLLEDPYALGRMGARGALDLRALRHGRRALRPGPLADREQVALARLVGRHFMRACRCLPGPQPESASAIRALRLPATVEALLLRGLDERPGPATPAPAPAPTPPAGGATTTASATRARGGT